MPRPVQPSELDSCPARKQIAWSWIRHPGLCLVGWPGAVSSIASPWQIFPHPFSQAFSIQFPTRPRHHLIDPDLLLQHSGNLAEAELVDARPLGSGVTGVPRKLAVNDVERRLEAGNGGALLEGCAFPFSAPRGNI